MSKRILVVDDEPNVRLSYRTVLEAEGYLVDEAKSAATGLEKLVAGHFDLAILDLRMPEMDGLELLAKIRERGLSTPTVMITAYGDLPHAVRAVKLGAIDFLQKPLTPEQLRRLVEEMIARHKEAEPRREGSVKDYAYHLRCAKRALNLRDFETAKRSLRNALRLDDSSAEGFNLAGVVAELSEDFANARRYYAQARRINQDFAPARQNAKRLDELTQRGASEEPFSLESAKIRNAN